MNALVLCAVLSATPIYTGPSYHSPQYRVPQIHASYQACSPQARVQDLGGGSRLITIPRPGLGLRDCLFGPAARILVQSPVPITVPPCAPQPQIAAPAACPPVNLPIQVRPTVLPAEPATRFRDIVDFELDLTVLESIRDLKENLNENDIRLLERIHESDANLLERLRTRIQESDERIIDKIGELIPVPQPGTQPVTAEQVLGRLLELNEAQLQALIAITEQLKALQNGNTTASLRPVRLGR